MKKLFTVFLLAFLVSAFAFAGSQAEEGTGASDEVMEITMTNWDLGNSFPESETEDPMRKYIEDKFNIVMKPVNVTWGDANEKLNIWAASGQLPDVIGAIATVGDGRYFQWIEDGVIRPLPDNLGKWPNVKKYVDEGSVQAYNVDDETYILPRATYEDPRWWAMDRGITARGDWMDKLGIDEPQSAEEFIDMNVRFATEDPDGNGKDDTMGVTTVGMWIFWSQCFTGYGFTDGRWIKEGSEYHLAYTRRNTLELFQFVRELYKRGGLDLDFATTDGNAAIENFASGRAGTLLRQVSPKHLNIVKDSWDKLQPDKDYVDTIRVLHPWPVRGQEYMMFVEKPYWSETYIEGSVDDAKTERILDLYNFLYSKEGIYMSQFGMEGEDYVLEGNEVKLLKTDADGNAQQAWGTYPIMTGGFAWMAAWNGDLVQYVNPGVPKEIRDLATVERDYRLSNWKVPPVDWAVQAINVPEKQDLTMDVAAETSTRTINPMTKN